MKTKTTLSISEARKRIFKIAEEVQKPNNYYTFTENGKPKVVLMSAEEFDSIMEDLEILSDPGLFARIQEAEKEIARGDYVTLNELKQELGYTNAELNTVQVADKGNKKYAVKKTAPRQRRRK
jgi:antitoxin YefM